ncbi:glycosyltransferase [Streptococcus mitis]|jgi:Lipopolysaccharide biosynthesis proteins, LPS:glycosyltransferases|uniref:Glycosyltransferase, family 8 n=1 Tax=Streptococcus mitis ATCC 6249 TaxID=864567 RepID=E0PPQ6_STRMT|nr:glycosyltransferase [Streptococcus mitis]EFM31870.1 glycosyltransferase, family 8 [Streptococcus mitis ATCC 6249]
MDTKKAIVLGADNNYRDKLETTIKSICYHNRDLKFYIFNEDIPKEWFYLMEKRLGQMNCEILNIEIDAEKVKHFSTPDTHIKYMTYFRYFIAEFVKEDRALYLDCDMVVHGNINPLFQKDFEEKYIIAVPDGWYKNIFNAGMMMVNVHKWKTDNICQNLLELTAEKHQEVYGDQGVLNLLFENKWKKVSPHYNFMVGLDTLAYWAQKPEWFLNSWDGNYKPAIIHFEGKDKPWNDSLKTRYRELWWFYNGLDWQTILSQVDSKPTMFSEIASVCLFHTAIFTDTQDLEHIEYLVESLSNVHFHIFAHSYFGPRVQVLNRFLNVSLYPNYTPYQSQEILSKLDFYLDINHNQEIDNIISKVHDISKPIFAFENTSHDTNNRSQILPSTEPKEMVKVIKQFLGE